MNEGLRGRLVKNKYSSFHTEEEFGLLSDLDKVQTENAHPESMIKRTTTHTIDSKQIQPDRFEINPWTKTQSDASSTLREFEIRPKIKELNTFVMTSPHAEIKKFLPKQPKQPTPLKKLISIRPRLEGKQFFKRLNEGRESVVV